MITITHTHADGTLIGGSAKGDGVFELLRGLRDNWRYFPSIRRIGLGQSRDRNADTYKIRRAAEALRNAGHEVTVTVDESERRDVATIEAERAERAEARAERFAGYAGNAAARADAAFTQAHQMADAIPFGQPILVGHHSEGRDRRYRARIESTARRGIEEHGKAEHYEQRAQAAEATQAQRESVPTTLRRIEKIEAEQRLIQRRLDGTEHPAYTLNEETGRYRVRLTPATGGYRERLLSRQQDNAEHLTYWQEHVKRAEASGVKVWSRDDFTKGDFVKFIGSWYEVLRVNAKSVTIPAMINDGHIVRKAGARCTWTDTVPYHKVKGRKGAAEIEALEAEAERREAEQASA